MPHPKFIGLLLATILGGPATAILDLSVAFAAPHEDAGWTFTPNYAVKFPPTWKLRSQSVLEGLGHELTTGRAPNDYVRIFVSGDKLTLFEFRTRMNEVIEEAKKKQSADLLAPPELVPFQGDGLRLKLIFKTRIKGQDYVEAHEPFMIGSQGADVNMVAPLARKIEALKELELMFSSLRVYWIKSAHPKPKSQ